MNARLAFVGFRASTPTDEGMRYSYLEMVLSIIISVSGFYYNRCWLGFVVLLVFETIGFMYIWGCVCSDFLFWCHCRSIGQPIFTDSPIRNGLFLKLNSPVIPAEAFNCQKESL